MTFVAAGSAFRYVACANRDDFDAAHVEFVVSTLEQLDALDLRHPRKVRGTDCRLPLASLQQGPHTALLGRGKLQWKTKTAIDVGYVLSGK
jgi:hypothetical protein